MVSSGDEVSAHAKRLDSLIAREPVRVYVYGVAVAVGALAAALDLVDLADVPVWLAVVGAVLAVPTVELTRSAVTSPATRDELDQALALTAKRPTSSELADGLLELATRRDVAPDVAVLLSDAAASLEAGSPPVVVLSRLIAEAMR